MTPVKVKRWNFQHPRTADACAVVSYVRLALQGRASLHSLPPLSTALNLLGDLPCLRPADALFTAAMLSRS